MNGVLIMSIIFATEVVAAFAFFAWAIYKQFQEEEISDKKANPSH
jgi:tellurite resistance protein TehA-like permease